MGVEQDKVVRKFNIHEDGIVLSCFHERDDAELYLMVETLLGDD
jgi:hypothetical protein